LQPRMSAPAILLIFGVSCPEPCAISKAELASIERAAVELLTTKGFTVKPAPPEATRPTGTDAIELRDEAKENGADRVVALDLEPPLEGGSRTLWITHFLRGTAGPWAVTRIVCATNSGDAFECPQLDRGLLDGLKPRKAEDVDMVAALRARAKAVGSCVRSEDKVPAAERIFGRLEIDLKVNQDGRVQVVSLAPAVAAKSKLGACLVKAMQSIDVGPFEGDPIELRVPVDL
jgi:hypothetical protein